MPHLQPSARVFSNTAFYLTDLLGSWRSQALARVLALLFLTVSTALGQLAAPKPQTLPYVWEHGLPDFGDSSYAVAVEALIQRYESLSRITLSPSERGKAGIKIYSESGTGLVTPPSLVRAVVASLVKRGFTKERILIVGHNLHHLRQSGYIQWKGENRNQFEGVTVLALDTGKHYSPEWFYDNNLPSREHLAAAVARGDFRFRANPDDRKSFLPAPLITDVDFFINLPMVTDDNALGISGALANPTVWATSNNQRFLSSPANAPVAVAEIASIPEYRERFAFTLMTLERYQFVEGRVFNSFYTRSEPRLWLSTNPVALDSLMWRRLRNLRQQEGFPVTEGLLPLLEYASGIGLGDHDLEKLNLIRIGE